jgi:hypothetical protein
MLSHHCGHVVAFCYVLTTWTWFDVHVTVHRRHSEGKEPTRCDKVCSFYCLNMWPDCSLATSSKQCSLQEAQCSTNWLDATKFVVFIASTCGRTAVWPHPPSSVHSKKPSASQSRRRSRYGHLKVEDIH